MEWIKLLTLQFWKRFKTKSEKLKHRFVACPPSVEMKGVISAKPGQFVFQSVQSKIFRTLRMVTIYIENSETLYILHRFRLKLIPRKSSIIDFNFKRNIKLQSPNWASFQTVFALETRMQISWNKTSQSLTMAVKHAIIERKCLINIKRVQYYFNLAPLHTIEWWDFLWLYF